ncbi:hypothetical protein [Armatimonas sp.]|uniref:hypothetical protein n=1 Tax=Armatimonas sp. TaxID=1872638 RepID=UPI00374FF01F
MKFVTFALTLTVLGALSITGCSSPSETPPLVDNSAPPVGTPAMGAPGTGMTGMPAPGAVAMAGGGRPGARQTSFDGAPEAMKKTFGAVGANPMGGGPSPMGGMGGGSGAGGSKPSPIRDGVIPVASRKDPFESVIKPVVQITPAWDYVMGHRTAPVWVPKDLPVPGAVNPDDLPPLPPVPRRVAGVFYNGGIAAIIESGIPPDSDVTIVQPGAEVDSLIPGVPPLVVESISMEHLILRARDGRSVEVKLSGLSPAVRGALNQQFNSGGGAGNGPGMGSGMGPGMGSGMGPGGIGGGKAGGGAGGGGIQ